MTGTPSPTAAPMTGRGASLLSLGQHLVALLLLGVLTIRLCGNLLFLRMARRRAGREPARCPSVSVLVPARDEAATITACLTSLLEQRYPRLEVLVLDDGSTDGTGRRLDALQARYPRLSVLHSQDDPPAGWTGKSYACARLAEYARGEWLLFTDADTLHAAGSVERGLAHALALETALLSAFPAQRVATWSERILVSFVLDYLPLLSVSLRRLWRGANGRVVANGQYLLVRAAAYRAVGGHSSVRGALVDDFALARRIRDGGYTVALVDGTELLSCRMYASVAQVWQGFSKNLIAALTDASATPLRPAAPFPRRLAARGRAALAGVAFAYGYACLFVLPVVDLLRGRRRALAGAEVTWLLLLRAVVVWRLRRPLDEIFSTPLAAWGVMAIGVTAFARRWRGRRVAWKGRLYGVG